jgi:arylsulfatase A-like enzyme
MKKWSVFVGWLLCVPLLSLAAERPNVVWIVSEDNSIHYLKHYFPGGAETPAIAALAAKGLTFEHAFSNAPVCSVARTTLATGCYGPRIGTQFHRRYQEAAMPEGLQMFSASLREAGYYTTNNSKKDYNAMEGEGVWDESSNRASWRQRPDKDQPFFHFQSHTESHESSLHFKQASFEKDKTVHDPARVALAPYHPDTAVFRYTHARYLDNMLKIDHLVAETVAQLEADGLLESTFIFYFGDHGGVLPRGKGYLYNTGLQVPLVVRVPERFRHLVGDLPVGGRVSGFVSFIDFGPTVLHLAGVPVPAAMDGKAFLGAGVSQAQVEARDEALGYADRMDEKYDFVRSLRKGRYHYMRCFQPWLPDGLQNNYRYISLAFTEWRALHERGQLSGDCRAFFEPRAVELLFDCEADPHNVRNLAGDPAHAEVLQDLRLRLGVKLRALPDLSFYPESHLAAHAMDNPVAFGQKHQAEIARLAEIADWALEPFEEIKTQLASTLASADPWQVYWAVMTCTAFGEQAVALVPAVEPLLKSEVPQVRLRALEFLGSIGKLNPQRALTELVNQTSDPIVATEVLNSVVWFRDHFGGAYPVARADFQPKTRGADVDRRLNYLNGEPYPAGEKKGKGKKVKSQ